MSALHYLTVQDILWINMKLAKKVNAYSYATLEEATFYQYSYGESKDVPYQAERFFGGFLRLKPISELNEATGLVGALAFLEVNGYALDWDDARDSAATASLIEDPAAFASRIRSGHVEHHGKPQVRVAIDSVLRAYPRTVAAAMQAYSRV
jgi:prophage maintenance system killer protein